MTIWLITALAIIIAILVGIIVFMWSVIVEIANAFTEIVKKHRG